jgi:predicted double-glycine peptidase
MMSKSWKTRCVLAAAGLGVALLWSGTPAEAGNTTFRAGGTFNVPVKSLKEKRFRKVVKQEFDFSCGSAALATLLTYHYDTPVSEREVFQAMYEAGDKEKIQTYGFSLLDMKKYLDQRNFDANGYRASLDKLMDVGIPAITLINTQGYMHFVVVKGVTDGRILVGDPALGMRTYERDEFEKIWNGILFVVTERLEVAQDNFNVRRDWRVRPKAPVGTAMDRKGLTSFSLTLPGPHDF